MAVAIVRSRAMVGLEAAPIAVEVHTAGGLPRTTIVGLPEAAVRESKDRVRSALVAVGFDYPSGRVTVNLAPADLPKEGVRFDLPIAIGILSASGQLPTERLPQAELIGELSLDGTLRAVPGALPCAVAVARESYRLLLPVGNREEASLVEAALLVPVATLLEAADWLCGQEPPPREIEARPLPAARGPRRDLADVRGQHLARRALEIAAAGRHHLIMVGPPGTGKTMLAERIAGILPPMDTTEMLETASIHSVSRNADGRDVLLQRPIRAPHHTTSTAGLIGGSARAQPGEISLAHNGVLFLDELGEFPRQVLEALRQPLESGRITVSRAAAHVEYPAHVQLLAAMNPCPCGYFGDGTGRCHCTPESVRKYQARVSGPLLDRIDLHLELNRFDRRRTAAGPAAGPAPETSAVVAARVAAAWGIQQRRAGKANRDLDETELKIHCRLDGSASALLERAADRMRLSERGIGRVVRVSRTIADLAGEERLGATHLAEAISLRRVDRLE